MAGDDPLDRCRGEVLAVDTDPVGVAPREVEDTVVVAVPEVPRPEPSVAGPLRVGGVVVVVALEARDPVAPDDLADRLVRVAQMTLVVETGPRAFCNETGSMTTTSASGSGRPKAPGREAPTGVMRIAPSLDP
jgi:hypothetical protein